MQSLRTTITKKELTRNLTIGTLFSFLSMSNNELKMVMMYSILGHLAMMSALLTKNVPKVKERFGMPPQRSVQWSNAAMISAFFLISSFAVVAFVGIFLVLAIIPFLKLSAKINISVALSVIISSIVASSFEVYEARSKSGSRWKALNGGSQVSTKNKEKWGQPSKQVYEYAYDPEIENAPDMVIEEEEEEDNYDAVEEEVTEIVPAKPATPIRGYHMGNLGSREGFIKENVPVWISGAFKIFRMFDKEAIKPPVIKKSDDETINYGPMGFRDKSPTWLGFFEGKMWSWKLLGGVEAARCFGTYRKTMYKKDKEVILRKYDR